MNMDFKKVFNTIFTELNNNKINYALMGGIALGFLGSDRITKDIDILVDVNDREKIKNILSKNFYNLFYESENVLQFISDLKIFGELDIIIAKNKYTKNMLKRARIIQINNNIKLYLLQPEDIIGLKLQAIKNDSERYNKDIEDIIFIKENYKLDKNIIKEYCKILNMDKICKNIFKEYYNGNN